MPRPALDCLTALCDRFRAARIRRAARKLAAELDMDPTLPVVVTVRPREFRIESDPPQSKSSR